jgi:hypothetical protein
MLHLCFPKRAENNIETFDIRSFLRDREDSMEHMTAETIRWKGLPGKSPLIIPLSDLDHREVANDQCIMITISDTPNANGYFHDAQLAIINTIAEADVDTNLSPTIVTTNQSGPTQQSIIINHPSHFSYWTLPKMCAHYCIIKMTPWYAYAHNATRLIRSCVANLFGFIKK